MPHARHRGWASLASLGVTASLVGVLLPSVGCERPGTTPQRVPGGRNGVLDVPYPIAEPERIEGAGRKALHEAQFVFVVVGATRAEGPPTEASPTGPSSGAQASDAQASDAQASAAAAPERHELPERWTADVPVVVTHHIELGGPNGRALGDLRRLAFDGEPPPPGVMVEVPARPVAELDLRPPADAIWLVGPYGTCQATLGNPVVGVTAELPGVVTLGFRLERCPGSAWAQVGIVAPTIPVDFRFVAAQTTVEQTVRHGLAWDDPLATMIEAPGWDETEPPGFDLWRLREIPGAEPRVLQLHHAWMSTLPGEDDRSWCDVTTTARRIDGWFNGRWVDPIPFHDDATTPFMIGAFLNGEQVDAVIYDDRFDALVVVPPQPLDEVDDPDAWRQVFVTTGRYDDATLQTWGIVPARGASPVGPGCDDG